MATETVEAVAAEAGGAVASPDAASASGGGIKAWLPLAANIALMPVLAYVMTTFVLVPKMGGTGSAAGAHSGGDAHGGGGHGKKGGEKITVALGGKVLVNVAGTGGTRYLQANMTLVGANASLQNAVEANDAQLRDVTAGILSSKTIPDLEKPGARNLLRTELIAAFNKVLGEGMVIDLYLTEFAIQ